MALTQEFNPVNLSASALIATGHGVAGGILVNSTTGGTLTLYDSLTASGTKITNATTLNAGTMVWLNSTFLVGLYAQIGGTADITIMWISA